MRQRYAMRLQLLHMQICALSHFSEVATECRPLPRTPVLSLPPLFLLHPGITIPLHDLTGLGPRH